MKLTNHLPPIAPRAQDPASFRTVPEQPCDQRCLGHKLGLPAQLLCKMGADNIPTIQSLEKPEKFQDVLRRDRGDDCLGCKIVGKSPSPSSITSGAIAN